MATRLKDVGDQFYVDIVDLKHVVAAYLTVQMEPPCIHVWTLLDTRDRETQRRLAQSELRLAQSFSPIDFDFSTIHLQDREPRQFVPEGAYPVKIQHPAIRAHFTEAVAALANAR